MDLQKLDVMVGSHPTAAPVEGVRTVRIGGEDLACPSFVHRIGHGWQLRFRRMPSAYFADSAYGGAARSLQAVVAARAQQLPTMEAMRKAVAATPRERSLGKQEQERKALKTGVVGVYLVPQMRRRTQTMQYTLTISCPGQKTQRLYVGTEWTWQGSLEAKLQEAKAIRERLVERRAASKPTTRQCLRSPGAHAGTAPTSDQPRQKQQPVVGEASAPGTV